MDDVSYEYIFGKKGAKMIRVLMCGPMADSGGVAVHTRYLSKNLSLNGVKIVFFDFYENKLFLLSLSKVYQRTLGLLLSAIIKKKKYDIIHIQSSGGILSFLSAITGCFVAKLVNKRIIITFHHSKTKDFIRKHKILFGYVLNNSDKMILVSDIQKQAVIHTYPNCDKKIEVIPNGYDDRIFHPSPMEECRKQLNLPLDCKIIINISNLIESKGHKYLIMAMNEILIKRRDVLCLIIGKGYMKDALQNCINQLGIQDNVKLLGWKPDEELPLWLNAADIFVFPSLAESFGIVQIEAMACGKAVVATINGGSEDILISEDYGLLVEPANSYNLADAIEIALNKKWNEERVLNYVQQYQWRNISKQIRRTYMDTL